MLGKYEISIRTKRISYELCVEHKISILSDYSATGKTTLCRLVSEYNKRGKASGVRVHSSINLEVLDTGTRFLEKVLMEDKHKLFIVDEDDRFVESKWFAKLVNQSDNYFLFITRSNRLADLAYSVSAIYGLKTEYNGNNYVTKLYNKYFNEDRKITPDILITEDSGAGFELINMLGNFTVVSAKGNGNVYNTYEKYYNNNIVAIFVDGSAFGAYIGDFKGVSDNIEIIAPESFEYLLLMLKCFKRYLFENELEAVYLYCNYNKEVITRERYFTFRLTEILRKHFRCRCSKSHLPRLFKSNQMQEELKEILHEIDFD